MEGSGTNSRTIAKNRNGETHTQRRNTYTKNQTHNHTTNTQEQAQINNKPKKKKTVTTEKSEDKLDAAYSTEQAIQHEGKEGGMLKKYT